VEVSQSPGLGVDYDWDLIEKTKIDRVVVR
jgi:L-alanine-DL-glutamate epimerase-like enolase superfamily enzyme